MNSFYIACHVIRNAHRIDPCFSNQEIQNILQHPLALWDILEFGHLKFMNIILWLLGRMPLFLFLPTIRLVGKMKKAI